MSPEGAVSADLLKALGAFIEPPEKQHIALAETLQLPAPASLAQWRIRHTAAFIEQCYPYASVYVGSEGAMGGEAADRINGFWQIIGARTDAEPDHLTLLLGHYAELSALSTRDARAWHARRVLLWEHLLSWLLPYLRSVQRATAPPYPQWACLMEKVFLAEAQLAGLPERMPLHLRLAPEFDTTAGFESVDQFLAALLTPVRSALVLTRQDLVRAAQSLGVGKSFGGRHFLLRTLLSQQPDSTLRWLIEEAYRQADCYRHVRVLGPVSEFWHERAVSTAIALERMETEAGERLRDTPRQAALDR